MFAVMSHPCRGVNLCLSCFHLKKLKKILEVKKLSPTSKAEIKNIDHLGIVARLIDEIGIVETINSNFCVEISALFARYGGFKAGVKAAFGGQ